MGAALAATLTLLLLASSAMYYIERGAQPDAFASIPHAMWWGIVTIATVGYGDVYPVTALGPLATRLRQDVHTLGARIRDATDAGAVTRGWPQERPRRRMRHDRSSVATAKKTPP